MSKRTRAAADFLGKAANSAAIAVTNGVKKQRVDAPQQKSIPTTTIADADNYSPTSIASLRALVDADGGPAKPSASLTAFQRRVYAVTRRIRPGQVSTYGAVAASLACPRAYRAVGNALRHNPFAPHVPCHRVLAGDGRIGGFAGGVGDCPLVERKLAMLRNEGIEFDATNRMMLKKDPAYRKRIVLQTIDAEGIDREMTDAHLTKQ